MYIVQPSEHAEVEEITETNMLIHKTRYIKNVLSLFKAIFQLLETLKNGLQ